MFPDDSSGPRILPPEPRTPLTEEAVRSWIEHNLPTADFAGRRVLVIIPDATRTAPLPLLFAAVHARLAPVVQKLDVLVALGTHPPLEQRQICQLLGFPIEDRERLYPNVGLFNHEWDNPDRLTLLGNLSSTETREISAGLLSEEVPVKINSRIADYETLLVVGPVFPHEVVGFSGGNKYFFPGIAGPEILNFFHWLGALITNASIIGVQRTPVRQVVDRAASLIPNERRCLAFVVSPKAEIYDLFYGTPESAWAGAAKLSSRVHITRATRPFQQVLSCAPPMYDELWVAGKCMYKLEPIVADGGELIIYAPHLHEISVTHGGLIREVGYHCRDYFLRQWERFGHIPRGVLAHSTHVFGQGTYSAVDRVEQGRVRVTLATGLPEALCREINLGYRDPKSIDIESFANREQDGVLLVRKAGEMLYRLKHDTQPIQETP
ncbi:MAG: lactate racemase domain-containing protein [Planctomycetota bacterium]|nr:lactate racemase domain-containing protein [Planctomycetota bacterium]